MWLATRFLLDSDGSLFPYWEIKFNYYEDALKHVVSLLDEEIEKFCDIVLDFGDTPEEIIEMYKSNERIVIQLENSFDLLEAPFQIAISLSLNENGKIHIEWLPVE